jgi:deazaflavin-dependent oxidoreductase (nitroreductase family)
VIDAEEALRTGDELVLTTTGRRTGRPHRVTVWFAYGEGRIWLRTDRTADWYRNLEREPRCRVAIGSVELEARREPVDDPERALRRLVELWRGKYGREWVADWYVERGRIPVWLRPELP